MCKGEEGIGGRPESLQKAKYAKGDWKKNSWRASFCTGAEVDETKMQGDSGWNRAAGIFHRESQQ